jgi:hypothetical protein
MRVDEGDQVLPPAGKRAGDDPTASALYEVYAFGTMDAANRVDTPLMHQFAIIKSSWIFKIAYRVQPQAVNLDDVAGPQGYGRCLDGEPYAAGNDAPAVGVMQASELQIEALAIAAGFDCAVEMPLNAQALSGLLGAQASDVVEWKGALVPGEV